MTLHFFSLMPASIVKPEVGGLGAVLLDKCGHVVQWFGCIVPQDLCDSFMAENQEQAIGELEALAVLVAYRLWGLHLKSKHLVCFLDNEGSRFFDFERILLQQSGWKA